MGGLGFLAGHGSLLTRGSLDRSDASVGEVWLAHDFLVELLHPVFHLLFAEVEGTAQQVTIFPMAARRFPKSARTSRIAQVFLQRRSLHWINFLGEEAVFVRRHMRRVCILDRIE